MFTIIIDNNICMCTFCAVRANTVLVAVSIERLEVTPNNFGTLYQNATKTCGRPNYPKIAPEPRRRPWLNSEAGARGAAPSPFPPNGLFSNPVDSESFFF